MNNKYLFAVFSFFINYLCHAQDIYFKHKPLFFFHEKTQQIILIENDEMKGIKEMNNFLRVVPSFGV